jgi:hypothetical protein
MASRTKPTTRRKAPTRRAKVVRPRPAAEILLELHRALGATFYALGRREGFPVEAFAGDFLRALQRLGMAGTPAAAFLNELRAGERDGKRG